MSADERAVARVADDYVARVVTVELAGGNGLREIPDDVDPEVLWATLCVTVGTLVATLENWAHVSGRAPAEVWQDCCLRLAAHRIIEEEES